MTIESIHRAKDRDPIILVNIEEGAIGLPCPSFYLNVEPFATIGYNIPQEPNWSKNQIRNALVHGMAGVGAHLNATSPGIYLAACGPVHTFETSPYEKSPHTVKINDGLVATCLISSCDYPHPFVSAGRANVDLGIIAARPFWVLKEAPINISPPNLAEFYGTEISYVADLPEDNAPKIADYVSSLRRYHDGRRRILRQMIVDKILASESPRVSAEEALNLIFTFPDSERLDEAIDLLVPLGEVLESLAQELAEDHEGKSDDYLYCVVRAVAKTGNTKALMQFAHSDNRSAREAVIEGLSQRGDQQSIQLIRGFADNDPSDFIRQLAKDILAEMTI